MAGDKATLDVPASIMESWQDVSDILAEMAGIPAALIMRFTDPDIEVFVSSKSTGNPYHPGEKEKLYGSGLYCETVIRTRTRLLVPDALADAHWRNNPDVGRNMISYMGYPILLPDGNPFGTICVLDNKRNEYSETVGKLMQKFRNLMESHLEILYMNQTLGDRNKRLADYLKELQALRGIVPICSNCKSIRDAQGDWHPIEEYLLRHPEADFTHGICPECMGKLYPAEDEDA